MSDCAGCGSAGLAPPPNGATRRPALRSVAIIGPPNSGKSTLFNRLTGLRQKVANYPGVTVEQRTGRVRLSGGRELDLLDLPGVYSLSARSEDERITSDVLLGASRGVPRPDAVILILDSTNLGRHLLLAPPILSLGLPTLVVLNMADDLHGRRGEVDIEALSRQLGSPVALISAAKGDGVATVLQFLETAAGPAAPLLELPVLNDIPRCRAWAARVGVEAGYRAPVPPAWTRRLDAVFLHPVAGPLVFLAVVVGVFETIFSAAVPLMEAVRSLVVATGTAVGAMLPDTWLRALLIEGVFGGVGSVVVFLPQILLLFLFIGILEDSGYLARAALIADRTMARAGLQGKSFIPLLSAYACAVPAILSTRTIENKRDRIATILIAPFMTCSARLPVYTLIIAAFIPDRPLIGPLHSRVAMMLALYVLGFLMAIATARLLKSSILKSTRRPFLLEMPPYRWPTLRSIGLRLLDRSKVFLHRAGTVILAVAICLWILAHVPLQNGKAPPIEESIAGRIGRTVEPVIQPLGFNWKIGIGLITSLAAREVIVGTLGTIYGIEGGPESQDLQSALRRDLTTAGAVALLIFFAFAMQCMSTLAVVRRETGGWKWPAAQFAYMTAVAYLSAFAAYRLLS
ncbi:MAG: ferrous iron transporter B [Bryobacteraceae bacterium]